MERGAHEALLGRALGRARRHRWRTFSYLVVGFHADAAEDPLATSTADTTTSTSSTAWSPTPELASLLLLHPLNEVQPTRDAAGRELDCMRRRLWFEWWKCVTDARYHESSGRVSITDIKHRISKIESDANKSLAGKGVVADCYVLSGRAAIFLQASLTLRNRVRQLLQKLTPEELDDYFASPEAVQTLLGKAINLEYFSAVLDGLQDHLATVRARHAASRRRAATSQ